MLIFELSKKKGWSMCERREKTVGLIECVMCVLVCEVAVASRKMQIWNKHCRQFQKPVPRPFISIVNWSLFAFTKQTINNNNNNKNPKTWQLLTYSAARTSILSNIGINIVSHSKDLINWFSFIEVLNFITIVHIINKDTPLSLCWRWYAYFRVDESRAEDASVRNVEFL